jgi:hypothetical protein
VGWGRSGPREDDTIVDLPIGPSFAQYHFDDLTTEEWSPEGPDLATALRSDDLTRPDRPVESPPWVDQLMSEAERQLRSGSLNRAIDLLELALVLEPRHDQVRARLHALSAERGRPRRRGDETIPLFL